MPYGSTCVAATQAACSPFLDPCLWAQLHLYLVCGSCTARHLASMPSCPGVLPCCACQGHTVVNSTSAGAAASILHHLVSSSFDMQVAGDAHVRCHHASLCLAMLLIQVTYGSSVVHQYHGFVDASEEDDCRFASKPTIIFLPDAPSSTA